MEPPAIAPVIGGPPHSLVALQNQYHEISWLRRDDTLNISISWGKTAYAARGVFCVCELHRFPLFDLGKVMWCCFLAWQCLYDTFFLAINVHVFVLVCVCVTIFPLKSIYAGYIQQILVFVFFCPVWYVSLWPSKMKYRKFHAIGNALLMSL